MEVIFGQHPFLVKKYQKFTHIPELRLTLSSLHLKTCLVSKMLMKGHEAKILPISLTSVAVSVLGPLLFVIYIKIRITLAVNLQRTPKLVVLSVVRTEI